MKNLWEAGFKIWDEQRQEYFTLKAIIFVTINDYPALFALSGQIKGKTTCVVCVSGTSFLYLPGTKKTVYMRHRHWLLKAHKYRKLLEYFDNIIEKDTAPRCPTGKTVYEMVQKVKIKFGKKSLHGCGNKKNNSPFIVEGVPFKKMSLFFEYLEYWTELAVHHAIDGMHVEKNVFENTIGLLDLLTKKKDGLRSRTDLAALGIRPELHPEDRGNGKISSPC